jgi:isopentenyl-diphosphate Delta-isomerase
MNTSSDNQIIIGANQDGTPTGEYFPKWEGHTGEGRHHFAITVLIYNNKGEVLIQKRKHRVFDNMLDMTASTHQLHLADGTNETDEEATLRSLKIEYGIDQVDLKKLDGFNYFEKYGKLCENEYDILLIGEYNGPLKVNSETAYGIVWMDKNEFLKDVEENPKKYTPWTIAGMEVLKKSNLFDN